MSRTTSSIPRPSDARLRELYVDQQLGCPEIGRMLGRDPTTVRLWLVAAGIPTRPRGSDTRQHFKAGHKLRAGVRHTPEALRKIAEASKGRQPYLRGGQHWLHTVSAEDNPNWKGGATPERQEFYRSQEWKAACCAVWKRADACCERCSLDWRTVDRKATPTFHVHHIVSFAVVALRAEPSNLALLCRSCHLWVHSKWNASGAWLNDGPRDQVHYLRSAEQQVAMPSLFDLEALDAQQPQPEAA